MLLEYGKIYKGYKKNNFLQCPTLEITTGVTVYVSDKNTKPTSVSEMTVVQDLENNKINAFITVPRWIAVTYTLDTSTAYEQGLVFDIFKSGTDKPVVVENYEALADNDTFIIAIPPDTSLIF